MHKWIKPILFAFIIESALVFNPAPSAQADSSPTPPPLLAQSAVLMDMTTGQILYEKNPHEKLYPASITKIMTALLALKDGHLSDPIRTSAYAASQEPNKVYLVPGEVHNLKQMLYGLLIDSGNDAAVAIAEHYGGSVKGFAAMMNKEAKQLGAEDTHFVNPNGLQDADHYTSAYDMALIARQAMQIPEFRKIVATKYYLWKGYEWTSDLSNLNEMLWSYPGAIGVKTGWTDQAEQTMVVAATRNGHTLLAVLMKVPLLGEMQTDATNLLNYGFSSFTSTPILPAGTKVTSVAIAGRRAALSLSAPLVADMPKQAGHQATKLAIPANLKTIRLKPGVAAKLKNTAAPTDTPTPTLESIVVAPLAQGVKKGAIVGEATLSYEHMQVNLPVHINETIPFPKTRQQRPPLYPLLWIALISLGASLLVRLQTNNKKSRKDRSLSPRHRQRSAGTSAAKPLNDRI